MRDALEEPFIVEVPFVFGFVEIGEAFFEMGSRGLQAVRELIATREPNV